jgi:glycosyltransferase involved in cell wall biosynthesis
MPIAVIPNGINPIQRVDPSEFRDQFPELRCKSIILFLGRIHHQKGVLNLLRAWISVAAAHSDAHLVLAGPEHPGTAKAVRQFLVERKLQASVTLCGILNGQLKLAAISAARFLCLPSYSEGFSVAVLEALSMGVPVVITPECNMQIVQTSGAGHVTSNESAPLADSLSSCLRLDSRHWEAMSRNAETLARSQFNWSKAASAMRAVYEWLTGDGSRPDCVVL